MGKRSFHGILLLLTLLLFGGLSALAEPEPMKIGVAGSPPFVVQKGKVLDGISVLIWESVAELEGYKYELIPYDNVSEALKAVKDGELDMAVGPISITSERALDVAFTQPYFSSGLGILSHPEKKGFWERVSPFFSSAFFYAVLFLLTLLGVVGTAVWIFERGDHNEDFPPHAGGLGDGMWFAIVTMTTVGYGDKCPKSVPGRIITAVWMLIATISFSTLTAGISSALTVSSLSKVAITSPEDMKGERVAVVSGTTGSKAAKFFGATTLTCEALDQAVTRLTNGQVEAVVFDHPALQHYVQQNPSEKLRLAHSTFEAQNYGFALPLTSDKLHHVNVALLKLSENGQIQEIEDRWLSKPAE